MKIVVFFFGGEYLYFFLVYGILKPIKGSSSHPMDGVLDVITLSLV